MMTEGRDFHDVVFCTCANLRRAARLVTQAYDAALQPTGLKATQFIILATLARFGSAPLTEVAGTLGMERTTLTRNLRPLERDGLTVTTRGVDRRVRSVHLTARGRRMFEDGLPLWRDAQTRMVQGLGPARWHGLLGDLDAAVAVLGDQRVAAGTSSERP